MTRARDHDPLNPPLFIRHKQLQGKVTRYKLPETRLDLHTLSMMINKQQQEWPMLNLLGAIDKITTCINHVHMLE